MADDELNVDKMGSDDDDEKSGPAGVIFGVLTAIAIIAIWLVIFGLLVKMDVGGFGSTVLRPILKNVPVVNMILPEATDEEVAKDNGYKYKNLAEAIERIKQLEKELEGHQNMGNQNNDQIAALQAEIDRLKAFENNQTYYEELKKKFDEEVVFNSKAPDIKNYKEWYEKLDKENAAKIYEQVLLKINYTEKVKTWAEAYSKMDAKSAAAILEEMTGDINLVSDILLNIKTDKRADILAAMDPTFAAKLTKVTHPTATTAAK